MGDAFIGVTEGMAKSVGCEMAVAAAWMLGVSVTGVFSAAIFSNTNH